MTYNTRIHSKMNVRYSSKKWDCFLEIPLF